VSFAAPQYLLALVVVPIAAGVYVFFERRRIKRSTEWSRAPLQPNIVVRPRRRLGLVPPALFLVGLTFLLVGFARPERANSSNGHATGPTVVLAFDVSGSMAAQDIAPSRLRAAREVAKRFVKQLPSNYQLSVVTFANKVHLVVPPTSDRGDVLAHLPSNIAPLSGTSIGNAIGSSTALVTQVLPQGQPVDRLHPAGAVVVFTDGAQTGGGPTPEDSSSTAFVYAIPINSVIVGTSHGSVTQPLKVDNFNTSIQIAVPTLPLSLQYVAQTTGGSSSELKSAADVNAVADKLAASVKKEGISPFSQSERGKHELSAAAGALGLAFLLGSIIVSGLWFGRLA
jgi:Ca-activated chloride channel family protein